LDEELAPTLPPAGRTAFASCDPTWTSKTVAGITAQFYPSAQALSGNLKPQFED